MGEATTTVREQEQLLRDGLACLQLSGAVFVNGLLTRPWAYHSPPSEQLSGFLQSGDRRILLFHIFTEGSARLRLMAGGDPVDIAAGDIVIFPYADQHVVGDPQPDGAVDLTTLMGPPDGSGLPKINYGGGGPLTNILCGYLLSDDAPLNPVLASLPPFLHIRSAGSPLAKWVESNFNYAMLAAARPGDDDSLSKRLPELLFTECICQYVRQEPEQRGWLAALTDPIVARALGHIHREPSHTWTLEELSRRAATSRSTLDERFRIHLGRAPMSYLIAYRLQLAGRQLRTTTATLAEIADQVGYGSEAAFSRAFKRHTGATPGEWRQGATVQAR